MANIAPEIDIDKLIKEIYAHKLVLYNDDVNSFDWVISCLIKICGHTPIQAEQCATIVDGNGKCKIKSGTYDELKLMHQTLGELGLTTDITE